MKTTGLEFLGTLAGGLVHEIKNPLSTLRINLTLLKEDVEEALPGESGLSRRIEVLENEVRRLDAILGDFMRYAGLRQPERRRHDLSAIVGEMAEFAGPGFELDGIDLSTEVASIDVEVDAALFKQAVLNILLNAQHATAAGGHVVVRGRRTERGVELEILDNGSGIDEQEQASVFEVYYSGSGTGSGLGLPTARRIMEEHGGGLELDSVSGKGTRVTLWLPAT